MNTEQPADDGQYKVVALKYRPQSFGELVGQGHIATALSNAIEKNRVGHAYLFTGARGVGKTSSARIFAKCLNCEKGPTMTPCNECDVCEAVSAGDDVDVLEIDGASNRGIDEIRQLRSNAAVRPSRSKYKIYIIDEVHMLTMQAFNALLKTLEEPPSHVKFIFCTTDPQKIPITVLSRCQRFDFSPVQTVEIAKRLSEIAENEGVSADEEALALLARRANGSMRDSQSLLEQLFSFSGKQISVDEVHQLLGTADMSRIAGIATAMANGDPTETLNSIHRGMLDGVDAGQMADQLLGYFRDMMAIRVGCGEDTLLNCTASDMEHLQALADALGLETILSIVQLIDAAVVRMQSSLHARTLLEAVAVRICNLEKLDAIADLVNSLAKAGDSKSKSAPVTTRSRPRVQMQQVEYKKSESKSPSKKNDLTNEASVDVAQESSADVEKQVAVDSKDSLNPGSPSATDDSLQADESEAKDAAEGEVVVAAKATQSDETALPDKLAQPDEVAQSAEVAQPDDAAQPDDTVQPELAVASNDQEPVSVPESASTESDLAVPGPGVLTSHDVAPTESMSASSESGSTALSVVTAANIESFWQQALEDMGDMTSDMASEYETIELTQPDLVLVTLLDSVNKDLCSKPERKQRFEGTLEKITGAKIRVDFLTSKRARKEHAPVPTLTRAQQIRQLQDDSFVKQTISLFDAEISGYREPMPTKKR